MKFLHTFELLPFLDTLVSLSSAFVFGMIIGAERQFRQRTAGLRTNVLVAVGAAGFVDLAQRIGGDVESIRVISYVVSGIGFLGAGVIMKEGLQVRGLNTAATLWCSAAIGACTGSDMIAEGALLTAFVVAGNTLLRPLANAINRTPINDTAAEAVYEVRLTTSPMASLMVRDELVDQLEKAMYPVREVQTHERGDDVVEVVATLVSSSVQPEEIEGVLQRLREHPDVHYVAWEGTSRE